MPDRDELIEKYETKLKKKNVILKIMYFAFEGFTVLTAIASLIMYFTQDTGLETTLNQMFMCVMCILFFNLPLLIERKFKVFIPGYILGVFYLFLYAHFVIGEVYRVYDHSILFDKILHTTSGAIYALLGFSLIFMLNRTMPDKIKMTPFSIVLFAFCFAMTTEYVWELVEFSVDRITGTTNMQRWMDGITVLEDGSVLTSIPYGSGLKDSMVDMFVNILGGLAVCVYAYIGMRLRPSGLGTKLIMTDTQIKELAREKADAELASPNGASASPKATAENGASAENGLADADPTENDAAPVAANDNSAAKNSANDAGSAGNNVENGGTSDANEATAGSAGGDISADNVATPDGDNADPRRG